MEYFFKYMENDNGSFDFDHRNDKTILSKLSSFDRLRIIIQIYKSMIHSDDIFEQFVIVFHSIRWKFCDLDGRIEFCQ